MTYSDGQEAHNHAVDFRAVDFRAEFRGIVQRYGVESEERYLWD